MIMQKFSGFICLIIVWMLTATIYMVQSKQITRTPECDNVYATCRDEADRRLIAKGCRYCYPHGGCTVNNSDDCNNLRADLITNCNAAAALCIGIGK
ncbi:unnamed protein product [Didymodactylos carnosus]|uniref:Uncharacterized protein n=1 Tax=Didymodactylos carnosus TaxID=1234261 RepID=A0A815ZHZ2_9BILA|nr:unnamed protein product [Didymodactylos carnosus]CAF1585027.1 unnamed protein product [Didymodactylos carnosus]CAF4023405.1 unnamed protein product [Didymodactylos carnosus]CAF4454210.1 unnamed protein product [Didymodactylos carnosus]